jgi:Family of unknown function (DUF6236)
VPLERPGLYYPYIHFRDEAWLRSAYLYWPSMGRIVPSHYPTQDSETVLALRDSSDFIRDVDPEPVVDSAGDTFMRALRDHGEEMRRLFTLPLSQGETDVEPTAYVHSAKIANGLRRQMDELGLLSARESNANRISMRPGAQFGEWIGMPSRMAAVYMCLLADLLARRSALIPTTDHSGAFTAVGAWNVDSIARALIDEPRGQATEPHGDGRASEQSLGLLAIDLAVPKGIEHIPLKKLIQLRTDHLEEFTAFRHAVASATKELSELTDEVDPGFLEAYQKDTLQKHFVLPQQKLKKAMGAAKIDTVSALLNIKVAIPSLVTLAGVASTNTIAVGAGGLMTILLAARTSREAVAGVRAADPSSAYLLEISKAAKPRATFADLVRRSRQIAL